MSFFTDTEQAELTIRRMILHVVSKKNDEFAPQAELDLEGVDHLDFFRARLLDSAVDSVHTFKDVSDTKSTLQRMAEGGVSFQEGAQELSRRFGDAHPKTSTSGAFFVFELTVEDPNVRLAIIGGEADAAAALAQRLRTTLHWEVDIPARDDAVELA